MTDELLMVEAPQLFAAADEIEGCDHAHRLRNGVPVTAAQLRKAAEILRDGPQPMCNGQQSNMPGFIHRDQQIGKSLIFQVGILPSKTYRIDKLGRARIVNG